MAAAWAYCHGSGDLFGDGASIFGASAAAPCKGTSLSSGTLGGGTRDLSYGTGDFAIYIQQCCAGNIIFGTSGLYLGASIIQCGAGGG